MNLVRRVAWLLFGLQLIAMLAFSASIYHHYALTWDFAIYHQAWWLIAHGNLAPFDTTTRTSFWGHHGEAIIWPLALLTSPFPTGATMLALQDLATVAAELVAFSWVCDVVTGHNSGAGDVGDNTTGDDGHGAARMPGFAIAACVLVLLLVNPWTWWSIAQDFHLEAFMAFFALMLARDVSRRTRRCWLWALLLLSCGDVAATIAIGVGISALIAGRHDPATRRRGLIIVALSALFAIFLVLFGADQSHTLSDGYGYVVGAHGNTSAGFTQIALGALVHPTRLLSTLYQHRLDVYGVIAAMGVVGIFTPWGAGVPTVVLLSNNLNRYQGGVFAAPGYQGFPATGFLAVGLASFIRWVANKNTTAAWALTGLLVANAIGWAAVWLPRTSSEWIHTTPGAVKVLNGAVTGIPSNAEVIASQGIAGRFSSRNYIYPYRGRATFPIDSPVVYFILSAYQGVETVPVSGSLAAIAKVSTQLGATLLARNAGIWVFKWSPPDGLASVTLPSRSTREPGWALKSAVGTPVTSGPPATWSMNVSPNAPSGYAAYGAYWRLLPGNYLATVHCTTSAPVNVEVWNDQAGTLIDRINMLGTPTSPIHVPIDIASGVSTRAGTGSPSGSSAGSRTSSASKTGTFSGVAAFLITPLPPPPGELIEVRVFVPTGTAVSISSVDLVALPGSPAPDPPGTLESQ